MRVLMALLRTDAVAVVATGRSKEMEGRRIVVRRIRSEVLPPVL